MDKRFITALALSAVVTAGWFYFFPPPKPPAPTPAAASAVAPTAANPPAAATDGGAATTAAPPASPAVPAGAPPAAANPASPNPAAPAAPVPVEKPAEQFVTVEEPGLYRAKLSTYGGAIVSWELLSPQYVTGKGKDVHPIELAAKFGPSSTLSISSVGDLPIPVDAIYAEQPAGANQKRFVFESELVKVSKTYTFVPKTYELKLSVLVESKLDRATRQSITVDLPGFHDPTQKGGGFFSPSVIVNEGVCNVGGKMERTPYDKLLTEPINQTGALRWAAIDRKFFAAVLAFAGAPNDGQGRCTAAANATGQMITQLVLPERALGAKGTTELELGGLFGPKIVKDLDRVRIGAGQVDVKLVDLMNYGMWGLTEIVARPLLAVLKAAHSVVPNWGIAVILLTILVKAALWWPTQKSMESMKKVAALKPEVDKLKARHGEDKNAFNMAVMELYRKEGVNPAGGCLPMLIQFPIFIGLFSMLGSSVELYRAPFVPGWIIDLTQPDPYFVLPVLLGGLMYVQQKVSPTAPDANQKTMMYGMQIAFVVASLLWPAGLTIYSLTNTLTSLLQQWLTNRKTAPKTADVVGSKPKAGKSNKKS